MSKRKKRVSLADRGLETETAVQAPPPPEETVQEDVLEVPAESSEPAVAPAGGDEEGTSRGIESHPLFWFAMGALTVGIIVLLGLLIMNPAPRAAAKVSPTATQGVFRPATATARPTVTVPLIPDLSPTWTAVALEHASVPRITVAEAKQLMDAGAAVMVDVRYPESYKAGHIKGAINIPEPETEQRLAEFPKDKTIILYCA